MAVKAGYGNNVLSVTVENERRRFKRWVKLHFCGR